MAVSNITTMRAILKHYTGRPISIGEICETLGIVPGMAVLCVNRIGTFGYDVTSHGDKYTIMPAPVKILVPRLRAMEAMAIHAGIYRFTIIGHGTFHLFGAVMLIASCPADYLYQLNIMPDSDTMEIKITGMGIN